MPSKKRISSDKFDDLILAEFCFLALEASFRVYCRPGHCTWLRKEDSGTIRVATAENRLCALRIYGLSHLHVAYQSRGDSLQTETAASHTVAAISPCDVP